MVTPNSDSPIRYVWPDVLTDISPDKDIDEQLERIWKEVRRRPQHEASPWLTQHGEYRAMLDWADVLLGIPVEMYEKYDYNKLVDMLHEWTIILTSLWHYRNRYSIARLAPESFKRIQVLSHLLWRRTRRPFAKALRARGMLDAKEVKQRLRPVSVYEKYGHLEKNGANRYKMLCPYHDDHTPSMVVYEDGGHWCFVCSKGGDVFDFIQHVERCNFPDAVGIAASLCG